MKKKKLYLNKYDRLMIEEANKTLVFFDETKKEKIVSSDYNTYLNSSKWKKKRNKVLKRDRYKCKICKKNKATEVHHKTYKHIFNERYNELISICKNCHRTIHGIS